MRPGRPNQRAPPNNQPSNETTHDDSNTTTNDNRPTPTFYEDLHPNTPFVFGRGEGFMDVFNSDPHAQMRKENIYHPFASKEEWGLASWLLDYR